ncbi:hypothetical protein [Methylocystis echinoides]|uniref:hypothetical protein n=1 Tax=Methylocystis echinoides TaxID=29468 RepID=UPI00341EBC9F
MRKGLKLSVGLACLVAMAAGGDALAKSRYRPPAYSVSNDALLASNGRTIDVERRSWLDPGTKVPVGSTNRYMLQQTYYNKDPVQTAQRSWYMQETLPQRPPYNADMIVPYDEGFPIDWLP